MTLKFMSSKIGEVIYGTTFNPRSGAGTIAFNTAVVAEHDLERALEIFKRVYAAGLNVGPYVRIIEGGESFQGVSIQKGFIGILTICSITIDGVLLKAGIPVKPLCGGIVQVTEKTPVRFTDILRYDSTTLDPLDVFMSQELTSVLDMINTGSGKVLASVREVPMAAGTQLENLLSDLMDIGSVSYTHLRAHETPEHLVCRLLLEKKKKTTIKKNNPHILTIKKKQYKRNTKTT